MDNEEKQALANALSIVDKVCSKHLCNRSDRMAIDASLRTIVDALNANNETEDATETDDETDDNEQNNLD